MTRRILAAVLVCVAVLPAVFPSGAAADEFEVPWSREAEISYRVALAYWGVGIPTECSSVRRILTPGPPAYTDIEQGRAVANIRPEGCLLLTTDGLTFSEMCPAVVHAVGHLMGLADSSDPYNVMYGGGPPSVRLCEIENARLDGFGAIAARRITRARERCVSLRHRHATKSRVAACRLREARIRSQLKTYLIDPYLPSLSLAPVVYEANR
jgi:hypothetical protein